MAFSHGKMASRKQASSQHAYQHGGNIDQTRAFFKHGQPANLSSLPSFLPPPIFNANSCAQYSSHGELIPYGYSRVPHRYQGNVGSCAPTQPIPVEARGYQSRGVNAPLTLPFSIANSSVFSTRNSSSVYSRNGSITTPLDSGNTNQVHGGKTAPFPAKETFNVPYSTRGSTPYSRSRIESASVNSGNDTQSNFRDCSAPLSSSEGGSNRLLTFGNRKQASSGASAPSSIQNKAPVPSRSNTPSHPFNSRNKGLLNSGNSRPFSSSDATLSGSSSIPSPGFNYGNATSFNSGVNVPFSFGNTMPSTSHNSSNLPLHLNGHVRFPSQNSTPYPSVNNSPFPFQPISVSSVIKPPQITSQEESDRLWLNHWLEQRKIKPSAPVSKKTMKIGEAHNLLKRCWTLNEQLKSSRDELIKNIESTDGDWETCLTRTNEIKNELSSVQEILSDPAVINDLQEKIRKRKKKRLWFKNRMKRRYLEQLEGEKRRELLHQKIDEWQQDKREKDLAARKEASLKHEAGGVLGEVRRKLQDGRKLIELLKSVLKLREIRKCEGEKKGVYPKTSSEDDRRFTEKSDFIEKLVNKRLKEYDEEEKALRVMMVEEEEEREKKEEKERLEQKALLNLSKEYDPLADFRRYYGQSEERIEYLIQIRREWDAYLVPDHVFGAGRIPDGDISPTAPSSDLWAAVLHENGEE